MDDMTAVRRAVDRLLGGDLGPMLDLIAEEVDFEVAGGGDSPEYRKDWGKRAVADHFAALGELVAFWQIDYGAVNGQVIAWGKESFTAEHCGLEGGCEFALVFELARGRIARFLVIEDLVSFFRRGGSLVGRRGRCGVTRRVSSPQADRAPVSAVPPSPWRWPSSLPARPRVHRR